MDRVLERNMHRNLERTRARNRTRFNEILNCHTQYNQPMARVELATRNGVGKKWVILVAVSFLVSCLVYQLRLVSRPCFFLASE